MKILPKLEPAADIFHKIFELLKKFSMFFVL